MPINNVQSDIITERVLEILTSSWLGIHAAATPNTPILVGTEVAKYGKPQRLKDAKYDRAALKQNGWQDMGGTTINIQLDQKRYAHYVVEDFDAYETPQIEQFMNQAAASMAQTMTGTLDAEFLTGVSTITPTSTSFTLSTAATDVAAEPFLNTLMDTVSEMEGLVNSETLTVNKAQIKIILPHKSYWRMSKYFKTYTQATVSSVSEGRIYQEQIGGVTFLKHPFLLNKYTKGLAYTGQNSAAAGAAGVNQDVDYDFTKLEAVILHNEAYALPWAIVSVKAGREPYTENDAVIMKYKFGKGAIRSYAIKTFQNAA